MLTDHGDTSFLVILATTSLALGYYIGTLCRKPTDSELRRSESPIPEVDSADDCKMVLVVRADLGMSKGKIAAQCSHAALACYKDLSANNRPLLRQWERAGQTKVALRCDDEKQLLQLEAHARSLKLCARSIQDAGRTQIAAGSRTVLGVAGPMRLVNQVTGHLRLL